MEQNVASKLKPYKDKQSGRWGFKNSKDEVVVSPGWWHSCYQFSEGLCPIVDEKKKFGFVDEIGNLAIPCKYVYALEFRDGLARVQEEGTFKIGYINHNDELVISFMYRKGGDSSNGLAIVSDDSGKWGSINHENELVYPLKYGWKELYDILYRSK